MPSLPATLCQELGCCSPHYKSMNCKNYFKVENYIVLIFFLPLPHCSCIKNVFKKSVISEIYIYKTYTVQLQLGFASGHSNVMKVFMNVFLTFTLAWNTLFAITVTLTFTRCLHPRKVKGKMTVHGQLKSFSFFFFLFISWHKNSASIIHRLKCLENGADEAGV